MAKFVPQPELSLNDQMQIRREKLAALQAEGRDPSSRPNMISIPIPPPSRQTMNASRAKPSRSRDA